MAKAARVQGGGTDELPQGSDSKESATTITLEQLLGEHTSEIADYEKGQWWTLTVEEEVQITLTALVEGNATLVVDSDDDSGCIWKQVYSSGIGEDQQLTITLKPGYHYNVNITTDDYQNGTAQWSIELAE